MAQASDYPYCNTTSDLSRAFKDIESFEGLDTLDAFTLTSGQSSTYEKYNTGYYGIVYQNGIALTEKTSIATVEGTVSTFWYDSTNNILYVHMDDGADPDTADTITAAVDDWASLKTTMRNDAMEIVESMLDTQYSRPLPFAANSYNSAQYDSDIRIATALIACSLLIKHRDPSNEMGKELELMVWNFAEDTGILLEYYRHRRAFSFESTKDEFRGNIEAVTYASTSTGKVYLAGNPQLDSRYKYRIKFNTAGVPGTAKFQFSGDGGLNYTSSSSNSTYSNWFHLTGGLYIRCEGTFVLNDEFEITVADSMEEVKSSIGSIRLNTSGY